MYFIFAGLALSAWKSVLEWAVNAINYRRNAWRNNLALKKHFFTRATPILPQTMAQYYKFNIGDIVRIDLTPSERRNFSTKWSFNIGK
jgi:hypothetical protein